MKDQPKDFFKPDGELVVQLLSRLMTRNNPDKLTRNADRLQFVKNVSNLAYNPALHLGFCTALIDKYAAEGKSPTFEIGLVMGAAMAMCSCSRANEKILKHMLTDIEKQQEQEITDEQGTGNGLCENSADPRREDESSSADGADQRREHPCENSG